MKPGIHWVGGIDWDIRNFHGYLTQRGTTYNAYLIIDEKTVLIDTVKTYLFDEMIARISAITDPSRIDIIVSNHVEMDHSGSLPRMLEIAPRAKVVTSVQGEKGLRRHYGKDWDFHAASSGEAMKIGKRTLRFVHTPMVHWPDNMVTWLQEENILFSNDAFGQHIASAARFDDEVGWDIAREEAAKYYANIVMPYGDQAGKALEALAGLEMDMIATSHGLIWRSMIPKILGEYAKWARNETLPKALIVYDSMWGSTEKIALKLEDGLTDEGVPVTRRNLKTAHISDVVADMLDSRAILIGSPTLNNGMLPTVGALMTYVKGLRPKKRIALAFGSYGWGGQSIGEVEDIMRSLGWDLPVEKIRINYIPGEKDLGEIRESGRRIGRIVNGRE